LAERATNFSHVFQPLGSIGVRHGCTGQLHNQLFTFGADGKPEYKFKAEQLLRGETDGSSYPNGGLRSKLIGFGAWALRLQ
jgi:glutamine synthetase